MISQSDLFKLFRMISRCVINCDECALRFYVCSIFVDRVFVLFIFHHGVHWTYKCFAYVAPRGRIWVRRGLCGFGDIRGSVGRYDPWGIKAAGFAITTKINHYAAVTRLLPGCGASGLGRSPTPDCPPSGRAAGAHYQQLLMRGAAGVGTRHQPHSARSCELALGAAWGGCQRTKRKSSQCKHGKLSRQRRRGPSCSGPCRICW